MRRDRSVQLLLSLLLATCSLMGNSVRHHEMQASSSTVRGPLCGRIVFQENEVGLVSIKPNGTGRRSIGSFRSEFDERISPDGTKVVFTRFKGNSNRRHVFVLRVRSDRIEKLTSGNVYDFAPSWAPDSKRLAFVRSDYPLYRIHELDLRTGETRVITDGVDPVYSPASSEMAFLRYDLTGTEADIFAVDLSTDEERQLTEDRLSHDGSVAWASDGSKLLFERYPQAQRNEYDGPYADIWSMDSDGSSEKNLTNFQDDYNGVNRASFSPDGAHIAYNTSSDAGGQVQIADADGTDVVRVTKGVEFARSASWAPDSFRIAFEVGGNALKTFDIVSEEKTFVYRTKRGLHSPLWVRCQ